MLDRKYDLLVMDVDNTLLCTDKSVSKKNQEAIDKCLANGVKVALASGRPARDVFIFAKEIGLEDSYHVSDNGNGLFKGDDIEILNTFNEDYYKHIVDTIAANNIEFGAYSATDLDFTYMKGSDTLAEAIKLYFKVTPSNEGDLYKVKQPYKLSAYFKNEEEYQIVKSLEKENEMCGSIPDPFFFDMTPANITKIVGTRALADKLGVDMSRVVAMGDQENDRTNVEGAGLGVAVSNAVERVKEVADIVLEQSCDEDAVAFVVDNYIF